MLRFALTALLVISVLATSCGEDSSAPAGGTATSTPLATPDGSTPPAAPGGRQPVILVHGWLGSPREMLPLKRFLDANGFHAFIAILPGDDNRANAEYLRSFVDEIEALTDVESVDVVGFSMGGLSLRHYIRFLGGTAEVSRYVSIDTPQFGDLSACLLPAETGGQMCPFSDFLNDLNSGDRTPGDVTYTTLVNEEGNPDLGRLYSDAREASVAGPHGELLRMPEVHAAVLAALTD
ncbi:MAG: esterase/lipase family protein [Dehalococcoidia bacterium]